MSYTGYEVFWFFLLYSFAGWVIGTSGLFLPELKDQPVFLFAGGVILSFIITSLTGLTLERIFHQKWKDYSRRRFNLVAMLTYLIR